MQPEDFPFDTFKIVVEIANNKLTVTQLNDEKQKTQVIENYKNKLRSFQKRKVIEKKSTHLRYSLRPR